MSEIQSVQTIVIGGGQAGLSTGYFLAKNKCPFVILDANPKIGDFWRNRWDSLRLFTPARFDGLAGMPFPHPSSQFPTKDEMADYLQAYASKFHLPVQSGIRVQRLSRAGRRYRVAAGDRNYETENVVVAMSGYQVPRRPEFSSRLAPYLLQLHSSEYRNPSQLQPGPVLIVGAGNSGAEIAMELSNHHQTWISGRDTGHIPVRIDSLLSRYIVQPILLRVIFHRLLTVNTPMGRKAKGNSMSKGTPLIRVKPSDLKAAKVHRVPAVIGVRHGLPLLADDRTLDVSNVIWSTGFHPGFSWIDLPVLDGKGYPRHDSGVVPGEPGLYFVGLPFLHAFSSSMIHGVARDAERIATIIASRVRHLSVLSKTPKTLTEVASRISA